MSYSLPTRKEWEMIFNNLSKREKIIFISFFLCVWAIGTLILIRIDRYHSTELPADGGTLTEGVTGVPRFINPLLALSDADRDLTRIIYSSLMKADGKGGLTPQLADRYEISEDGLQYTFHLREKLFWHDNQHLTSADIAFTITQAKNPSIRSSRLANWEGVTFETPDEKTIIFHLKKPYAPFLESTTIGIMPKHLWSTLSPEEFNLSNLNTHPIGSGPYQIESVVKNTTGSITSYTLSRFNNYATGRAHIKNFVFKFYPTEKELANALTSGDVDLANIEISTPLRSKSLQEIQLPRIVGIFFNQDNFAPLKDLALRDALSLAADRDRIIREATNSHARPTSLPTPPGTTGYDESLEHTVFDIENARAMLTKAGYTDSNNNGTIDKKLKKNDKDPAEIRFTLATLNTPELIKTAEILRSVWKEIGVELNIQPYEQGDLEQNIIRPRNYDAILFGQAVGYFPDPFAFWHTSQRTHPGLNLALYANTKVDKVLEDARITTDTEKRKELYKTFLTEYIKDAPAIILYSPSYLYITPANLKGTNLQNIPFPQERFSSIETWYTNTSRVWNIFVKN
ncbi:MAG: peptide ABC transporter substrate-binding protein [Patescibacteria group bacterium]